LQHLPVFVRELQAVDVEVAADEHRLAGGNALGVDELLDEAELLRAYLRAVGGRPRLGVRSEEVVELAAAIDPCVFTPLSAWQSEPEQVSPKRR
jgi:hypothetical protein